MLRLAGRNAAAAARRQHARTERSAQKHSEQYPPHGRLYHCIMTRISEVLALLYSNLGAESP